MVQQRSNSLVCQSKGVTTYHHSVWSGCLVRLVLASFVLFGCNDKILGSYSNPLDQYLQQHPKIIKALAFEMSPSVIPGGTGQWLDYQNWSTKHKERLLTFFTAFSNNATLPLPDPSMLKSQLQQHLQPVYPSVDAGLDTYFAQAAHALWLDISGKVPWKLQNWSSLELEHILSSRVCFTARHENNKVVYVFSRSSPDVTNSFLDDPRIPFRFMESEPEQGKKLIGATPSETAYKLTEWFHDYLHHASSPPYFSWDDHLFRNPMLADRLKRYTISWPTDDGQGGKVINTDKVYVTDGCHTASTLFCDLMRSVNIPVCRVYVIIGGSPEQKDGHHRGLAFNWSSGENNRRYLLHTDYLYETWNGEYLDPAPAPKGTERGIALWNHVWLSHDEFSQRFTLYDPINPNQKVFAFATDDQEKTYRELSYWLVSSPYAIKIMKYYSSKRATIASLKQKGLTDADAEAAWQAVKESILSYGNGNWELGYEKLMERHSKWCLRTNRCSP